MGGEPRSAQAPVVAHQVLVLLPDPVMGIAARAGRPVEILPAAVRKPVAPERRPVSVAKGRATGRARRSPGPSRRPPPSRTGRCVPYRTRGPAKRRCRARRARDRRARRGAQHPSSAGGSAWMFASCPWPPSIPPGRENGIRGRTLRLRTRLPFLRRPPPPGGAARGAWLMRGIGGSTLRGGQTVFHGLRMWGQLFQAAMFLSAFMTVAVPAWTLWHRTDGAEWYAAGMVTLAEVKLVLGYRPDSGQEIRFPDGTRRVLTIRDIAASVPAIEARERIKSELFASAWLGAKAGLGVIALFLAWFWWRGVRLSRQRRIRGAELVTAGELRRRVRPLHLRARDPPAGLAGAPGVQHRRHPVSRADRDPAHDRLGHHRLGQNGADLRSRRADSQQGRALRRLRQDGELHGGLLRSLPRRAAQSARREGAALVAVLRGAYPPRLRHDGRRAHPAAEGHGGPLLGDGGAAIVCQRRWRAAPEGRDAQPGAGRPPAQDRADRAGAGDGGHGRPVHRRSRQPQDGAQRARHAHGQPLGAGVPAR